MNGKKSSNHWGAFANTMGGKVVVGLADDGAALNMQVGKTTIEDFVNKLKANSDPVLYPSILTKTHGLGKIVEIDILASESKPIFVFDRSYKRVGKTNIKISNQELRSLIKNNNIPEFDKQLLGEPNQKIEWSNVEPELPVTNGYYLCHTKVNKLFTQAHVKVARFKGNESVDFIDVKTYNTNLIEIVDIVLDFIKRHTNKALVIKGEAKHTELWQYPLPAIREAVVNAIVHRDYADNGNVQIRIFDNRLEVWSPGILPKEIDIESLSEYNRSIPRNTEIAQYFSQIGLIENWGTGFSRIFAFCKLHGNIKPIFSERQGAFVVTFGDTINDTGDTINDTDDTINDTDDAIHKLSNRQYEMKQLFKGKNNYSVLELGKKLEVSEITIKRDLKELIELGVIQRIGSNKNGYWIVK